MVAICPCKEKNCKGNIKEKIQGRHFVIKESDNESNNTMKEKC